MDHPLPLRNFQGEFPTLTFFNRTERQAKGTFTWPWDRLTCNFSHTLKRKMSEVTSVIPNLMNKRQRRLFFGGFSILSEDESAPSDSTSEYSITSSSSSFLWDEEWAEWTPPATHFQALDLFIAELDFRNAAQEHFSPLDVEGLIADPGHEIISYEIFRGDPERFDQRLPHMPIRGCSCHACATYNTSRDDFHDPGLWCHCFDCDHYWFMVGFRWELEMEKEEKEWKGQEQKEKLQRVKAREVQQQEVLIAEKPDDDNDAMQMLDYYPEEQLGGFDDAFRASDKGFGDACDVRLFDWVHSQLREGFDG